MKSSLELEANKVSGNLVLVEIETCVQRSFCALSIVYLFRASRLGNPQFLLASVTQTLYTNTLRG